MISLLYSFLALFICENSLAKRTNPMQQANYAKLVDTLHLLQRKIRALSIRLSFPMFLLKTQKKNMRVDNNGRNYQQVPADTHNEGMYYLEYSFRFLIVIGVNKCVI
ncbi:MAG: hypothetical protein LKI39_08445 [Bacteroides sp.]|nr:hypothetical protein [Bacteroides sp.]